MFTYADMECAVIANVIRLKLLSAESYIDIRSLQHDAEQQHGADWIEN